MTTKEIMTVLIEDKGYDRKTIERMEQRFDALSPDIKMSLENWINTGEFKSPEYEGYDVNKLMKIKPLNEVGAYMMLNWLKTDPDTALKAVKKPFITIKNN